MTGSFGAGFGYCIWPCGQRFFGKRFSKGHIPADGHLRFIFACAELAQIGFALRDIELSGYELKAALTEAGFFASSLRVDVDKMYIAEDVLKFKEENHL